MVVLDSSFLIAYHNQRDAHHGAAAEAMQTLLAGTWGQALLLEYVFLEVVTVLQARRNLAVATQVADVLLHAEGVEFVPCSDLFLATLDTFRQQGDRDLSFADAAIVTLARQRKAELIATFDRDFLGLEGISVVPIPAAAG